MREARGGALILSVSLLLVGLGGAPGRAVPVTGDCFGSLPTIVGTPGDDEITGTDGDDVIVSLTGNDRIDGGAGNDAICSGMGDDVVLGGPGVDGIAVEEGADVAKGEEGTDLLVEFAEDSFVLVDVEVRDLGADRLLGGPGNDVLSTEGGNDVLDGGPGSDHALHISSFSPVVIDLGRGSAVSTQGGVDELISIENASGSVYNDLIVGSDAPNHLFGVFGEDYIFGMEGADRLYLALDGDLVDGGEGQVMDLAILIYDVAVTADMGSGTIAPTSPQLGDGTDRLLGIEGLTASSHGDTLIGDALENVLVGNGGDDEILGGPGDDRLYGDWAPPISPRWAISRGEDTIEGGAGQDYADGGLLGDSCIEVERSVRCETGTDRSAPTQGGYRPARSPLPWWADLLHPILRASLF